jgi:hypothetical protein
MVVPMPRSSEPPNASAALATGSRARAPSRISIAGTQSVASAIPDAKKPSRSGRENARWGRRWR